MSAHLSAGEVVVCRADVAPCCGGSLQEGGHPGPKLRATYRVVSTGLAYCTDCGTGLGCIQAAGFTDEIGWPESCFERVTPATVDIFALSTVKILEPA